MSDLPTFEQLKQKFCGYIETIIEEHKEKDIKPLRNYQADLKLLMDCKDPIKCFTNILMLKSSSGSLTKFIEQNYAVELTKKQKKKIKKYFTLLRVVVRNEF